MILVVFVTHTFAKPEEVEDDEEEDEYDEEPEIQEIPPPAGAKKRSIEEVDQSTSAGTSEDKEAKKPKA